MASGWVARDVDVLNTAATLIAAANTDRRVLMVYNEGPNPIYVGDAAVTTATGYPVLADNALPPVYWSVGDPSPCEALYAIAGTADQSGTDNTRVLESFAK